MGDVTFDVADRLAIMNLLGATAQRYDEARLDDFRALFTQSPEIRDAHGDQTFLEGFDALMGTAQARHEAFAAAENQRRHALDSMCFTTQGDTEATGRCYFPGVRHSCRRDAFSGAHRVLRVHCGQAGRCLENKSVGCAAGPVRPANVTADQTPGPVSRVRARPTCRR
jgi:hypothetical protein